MFAGDVSRVWQNNKKTPEPRCQLVGTGEEMGGTLDTPQPTSHILTWERSLKGFSRGEIMFPTCNTQNKNIWSI